jgi:hypothetical protein
MRWFDKHFKKISEEPKLPTGYAESRPTVPPTGADPASSDVSSRVFDGRITLQKVYEDNLVRLTGMDVQQVSAFELRHLKNMPGHFSAAGGRFVFRLTVVGPVLHGEQMFALADADRAVIDGETVSYLIGTSVFTSQLRRDD